MSKANRSLAVSDLNWCLDFTDTVDWRNSGRRADTLSSYEDLVRWSLKKGILSQDEASTLTRASLPTKEGVLKRAVRLREATYRVFSAVAHGKEVDQGDLGVLNEFLSEGLGKSRVVVEDGAFVWTWKDNLPAEVMLYALAHSAADLLTSEDLARVKECANEEQGCGSLFLDCSKGLSRRWCSMESCGNRAKLKSYYLRHRGEHGAQRSGVSA